MALTRPRNIGDPASIVVPVTPSDTEDFESGMCSFVHVGSAGDVVCYVGPTSTTAVTFSFTGSGRLDAQVRRVLATGTTATGLVAMY